MSSASPRVLGVGPATAPEAYIPVWRRAHPLVLAWLGLAGLATFVLTMVLLHVTAFRQEMVYMSEFANTRFWPLWNLSIISFTIAGAALSLAVRAHLDRSLFQRTGFWMIWLAVACAVVLAAVPMDGPGTPIMTVQGIIHGGAAVSMFMLLGTAMMALAPAFRRNPLWRWMGIPSLLLGTLVNGFSIAHLITALDGLKFAGVAQRLMVMLIVTWSVLVATRLLQVSRSERMRMPRRRSQPRGADGRFVSRLVLAGSPPKGRRDGPGRPDPSRVPRRFGVVHGGLRRVLPVVSVLHFIGVPSRWWYRHG